MRHLSTLFPQLALLGVLAFFAAVGLQQVHFIGTPAYDDGPVSAPLGALTQDASTPVMARKAQDLSTASLQLASR